MKDLAGHRVLMLLENNSYVRDGRVRQEAKTLVNEGYSVTVICPSESGQPWHETRDGARIYGYPAPPAANSFLGYAWEYSYAMAATFILSLFVFLYEGFDVVHAHNPPDTFVLIAAFYKLFGRRFVYDHHDLAPEMYYARFGGKGNRLVYHVLLLFEQISCRLADHVITTNLSYKAIEMQRGHVQEELITVVRNGPELDNLQLANPHRGLPREGKTIIGYAGGMGYHDGVEHLLRALRHLICDLGRTGFFCILVGAGDAFSSLKSLAKELDLTDFVLFTGWVDQEEVTCHLSSVDICVAPEPSNPYNDRSTVIKIMEYMAMEKPIVAFDLPEHRFSAREAALYVRPNDDLEFAQALAQLMDDPERRQVMGSFGRKRVETELAWCYSSIHLLQAYRTLFFEQKD